MINNSNNDAKQFLLSPAQATIESLSKTSKDIASDIAQRQQKDEEILHSIAANRLKVENLKHSLVSLGLIQDSFEKYKKLEIKLNLLRLSQTITKLRSCDVADIPSIVLEARDEFPSKILKTSRIYKFMNSNVNEVRQKLLAQFHELFETHLEDGAMVGNQHQIAQHAELWRSFIPTARVWLMSFAVVSIFPVVCTESTSHVSDRFQAVLDESFTPLWARFYFHLERAREAHSMQQMLWTFSYAKSFVKLLIDICLQITSAGMLQRLCDINYDKIILKYVVDKCLSFMRAHIAQILVEITVLDSSFCVQFFEECAEFDSFLDDVHREERGAGTLCAVLFAAKAFFKRWLQIELSHVNRSIVAICSSNSSAINDERLFRSEFSQIERSVVTPCINPVNSIDNSSSSSTNFKCYAVVYNTSTFLLRLLERYAYFPKEALKSISEVIIEPLLCICAGLFLYRIRSSAILGAVTSESFSRGRSINASEFEIPEDVTMFIESAEYMFKLLSPLSTDTLLRQVSSSNSNNSETVAPAIAASIAMKISKMPADCDRLRARWAEAQESVTSYCDEYFSSSSRRSSSSSTSLSLSGNSMMMGGAGCLGRIGHGRSATVHASSVVRRGGNMSGLLELLLDTLLVTDKYVADGSTFWPTPGNGSNSSNSSNMCLNNVGECVDIVCSLTNALSNLLRQQLSARLLNAH